MSRPQPSGTKHHVPGAGSEGVLRNAKKGSPDPEAASLASPPRMILDRVERTHIFQDVPDDIRHYFNTCFLRGESPYETAKIYGVLARVSHAHQAEVAEMLRAPWNGEVCLAHSATLLSKLTTFNRWQADSKRKLAERIDALLTGLTQVQLPLALFESKTLLGVMLYRVLASPTLQRVVLDYSDSASLWKKKTENDIKPFNIYGDWEFQQTIFTQLVLMPVPAQRQIKIELVFRNRILEAYNLNMLVEDGAGVLSCLRKLDINGLGFSQFGIEGNSELKELGRLVNMATALEELDLGDSIIDSHMLAILAGAIEKHPALRVLSLQNNLLCRRFESGRDSQRGWTRLMQVLPSMPKLEMLDLRGNRLDDVAATGLMAALKSCKTIKCIKLSQNNVSALHPIWQVLRSQGRGQVLGSVLGSGLA